MRPFRLKKTITHATVLSALFPSVAALSQQLPVGFYGKITTVSAGAAAILGHELVPTGTALQDPAQAPSRGGYVYDSFNSVVRSGVTRECVKHGLWSLEIATPDCEPWLFATPAPAQAPKAAAAPAPAPKAAAPAPAPAPAAPKEEGFPEWMGPAEAALGIVPLWAEDGVEPEDAVGASVMHYGSDEDDGTTAPEGISDPIHYGEHEEDGTGDAELLAAPLVYFHDGDDAGAGDDLIGAPIAHDDNDGMAHLSADQWPADPHASGDQEPETASNDNWVPAPAGEIAGDGVAAMQSFDEQWSADPYAPGRSEPETASNDNWVPTPGEEKAEEPGHSMLEFKEEEQWPGDSFAGQDDDRQAATEDDTSWLIPNPLPDSPADEMIGRHEEDAKEPGETIVGHSIYHDDNGSDDANAQALDDTITGHSIYHEDGSSGVDPAEDAISFPQHYAEEEVANEPEPEQMAVAPYKSPYDDQPFAEAAEDDEEEGDPFTSHFDASPPAAIVEPPPVVAAAPAPAEPSVFPEEPEEEEEEQQPYSADYSKVPTAKVEPAPAKVEPAPPKPPAKPAPVAEEEHLMTVVLSADALFDFDRYVLRPAGKKSLDDFVAALQDIKWGQILVVGHSDRLGSAKYNVRLSERRAQAVRKQLIAKGLDGKKIKAAGKGKAQPVSSGCVGTKRTKELIACLQPDRRVEIFVDEKREVKITKPVKPKK